MLGAVNPKDGTIVWRQRLVDASGNVTARGFLSAGEGEDTVISAVGEDVQAWDAADGRLVWAWKGRGQIKSLEIIEAQGGAKDVLVLSEEEGNVGVVRKLKANSGEVVWEHKDTR